MIELKTHKMIKVGSLMTMPDKKALAIILANYVLHIDSETELFDAMLMLADEECKNI